MRVTHVIKVTGIAGAERHLLMLLSGLRACQVDAEIVLLVEPDKPLDEYVELLTARDIPARRVVIHNDVDMSLYWRLRRALRETRPDIVHTHLWHADFFGIPAARLAGVRTVITSRHNDDAFRHRNPVRTANYALWRIVSAGIAISEAIRQFSIDVEGAPSDRIHTVRYGLEYDPTAVLQPAARKAIREELGLGPESVLAGMVCRLTEQKGVSYGLEAFARVAAAFPEAQLVIAGDGPLRDALQARASALDVAERVHFLGWRDDVLMVLAALDVLLMPSLWEGFGLVMLEAMSQQVPLIGSAVSAIPEVIAHGESGLLVPPRDAAALADALHLLLRDKPLRRHMGLVGQDRLDTHFSAARMVDETLTIYQRYRKN